MNNLICHLRGRKPTLVSLCSSNLALFCALTTPLVSDSRVISKFGTQTRFFSSDDENGIGKITPTVIYTNADTQKILIFKENRDKAGIYR